jgi:hypothetical protein
MSIRFLSNDPEERERERQYSRWLAEFERRERERQCSRCLAGVEVREASPRSSSKTRIGDDPFSMDDLDSLQPWPRCAGGGQYRTAVLAAAREGEVLRLKSGAGIGWTGTRIAGAGENPPDE